MRSGSRWVFAWLNDNCNSHSKSTDYWFAHHLCSRLRWFDSCSRSWCTRPRRIWGRSPSRGSPSAGRCKLWPASGCRSLTAASRRGTSARGSAAPRRPSWCSASSSSRGCWRRAAAPWRADGWGAAAPCARPPPGLPLRSRFPLRRRRPPRVTWHRGRWRSAASQGTWTGSRMRTRATAGRWPLRPAGRSPAEPETEGFGPPVPRSQNLWRHPGRSQTTFPPYFKTYNFSDVSGEDLAWLSAAPPSLTDSSPGLNTSRPMLKAE